MRPRGALKRNEKRVKYHLLLYRTFDKRATKENSRANTREYLFLLLVTTSPSSQATNGEKQKNNEPDNHRNSDEPRRNGTDRGDPSNDEEHNRENQQEETDEADAHPDTECEKEQRSVDDDIDAEIRGGRPCRSPVDVYGVLRGAAESERDPKSNSKNTRASEQDE